MSCTSNFILKPVLHQVFLPKYMTIGKYIIHSVKNGSNVILKTGETKRDDSFLITDYISQVTRGSDYVIDGRTKCHRNG